MKIEKNKVVAIDYTLTDSQGKLLDSSSGHGPLHYLHGFGNLIPGLEKELEGKVVGNNLKAIIPPEEAYGVRNDELRQKFPKEAFDAPNDLEEGMQFEVETEEGYPMIVTIVEMDKETVTVDGNHPLAGVTLHFDVTVKEIREASAEELAHGHVHGPHGHHH